jgi:hypothetical protein
MARVCNAALACLKPIYRRYMQARTLGTSRNARIRLNPPGRCARTPPRWCRARPGCGMANSRGRRMSGFIEIQHDEWVAAAPDVVRAHYTDLHHRQVARVHPHERLRQLAPGPTGPRFECVERARAGAPRATSSNATTAPTAACSTSAWPAPTGAAPSSRASGAATTGEPHGHVDRADADAAAASARRPAGGPLDPAPPGRATARVRGRASRWTWSGARKTERKLRVA